MRPRPEQSRVVQRPQSPAHGEQHVLQHVFGVRGLVEQGREATGQESLGDADQSLEMFAAPGLRAEDQPRFVCDGDHVRRLPNVAGSRRSSSAVSRRSWTRETWAPSAMIARRQGEVGEHRQQEDQAVQRIGEVDVEEHEDQERGFDRGSREDDLA